MWCAYIVLPRRIWSCLQEQQSSFHPTAVSVGPPSSFYPFFLDKPQLVVSGKRSSATMLTCEPLCQFSTRCVSRLDGRLTPQIERVLYHCERLFFTSFPSPTPHTSQINRAAQLTPPKIRSLPRSTSPEDQTALYYYFTIDDDLTYLSFFEDWGPLNIAMVYRACIYIHEHLEVSLFVG